VLHDGPLEALDDIVSESLAMLGAGNHLPEGLSPALRTAR
jgi:3-(3-hydroxy-phenyl)propionate hydroxylase